MKLLKFPVRTHIIKAVCDCGTELEYVGQSMMSNPPLHGHLCKNCMKTVTLKSIYPKYVHEQFHVIGDEVNDTI